MAVSLVNSFRNLTLSSLKSTLHNQTLNNYTNPGLLSLVQSCPKLNFIRTKMIRPIRGHPRPLKTGEKYPEPRKYKFRVIWPEDGQYTTEALKIQRLGGRDPETGRVLVETLGGGHKQKFRWVDYLHKVDPEKPYIEKIQWVRYCPVRTARIALAQSGDHSRWVIAHQGMKEGDLVTTYSEIPRIPIRPKEGDSHPVGALPVGTMIFNIAPAPGVVAKFCKAAGSHGTLIRKTSDKKCVILLPSKREIAVSEKAMVTVGRASNLEKAGAPIGSAQRLRWLGWRPRSGLKHRKDGNCGRKIKPPKKMKVYPESFSSKTEPHILTL